MRETIMSGIFGISPAWGVTAVRVMTGLLFVVHGYQKFARGLRDVSAYFAKILIPFPGVLAPFIASLEVVGGILLIIGLLTRVVSALFAIEMLVTTVWVKLALGAGWNASDLDRMLLVAGILMVLAGPGAAAVDNLVFKHDNKRSIL
jgi:putative oxidoreductase